MKQFAFLFLIACAARAQYLNPPRGLNTTESPAAARETLAEMRKINALPEKNPQLVLELTDVILAAEPSNHSAQKLRAAALEKLGQAAANTVERNVYLVAAQEPKE